MTRSPLRALIWIPLALLLGAAEDDCADPDILVNFSFDMWCGEELCGWEVEAGEVLRAPTWHSADYGAQLVGDEVIISQLTEVNQDEVQCIAFQLMADRTPGVRLTLEMDFLDDGAPELTQTITADDWSLATFVVTPPERFQDLRFRISKQGSGDAVVGQIRALAADSWECEAPALTLADPEEASEEE
jgi:hypothetical protein